MPDFQHRKLAISRLNTDGTVDMTFETTGFTERDYGFNNQLGVKARFDEAGRLVVVTKATETGFDGMNVVRYYEINNLGSDDLTNYTEITLFPNPSSGVFNINTGETTVQKMTVFDAKGQVVFSSDAYIQGQKTIILPETEPGMYLVYLESDQGQIVKHLMITK